VQKNTIKRGFAAFYIVAPIFRLPKGAKVDFGADFPLT
jgi:hypothetical protein